MLCFLKYLDFVKCSQDMKGVECNWKLLRRLALIDAEILSSGTAAFLKAVHLIRTRRVHNHNSYSV